jgi:hypothetical protein
MRWWFLVWQYGCVVAGRMGYMDGEEVNEWWWLVVPKLSVAYFAF